MLLRHLCTLVATAWLAVATSRQRHPIQSLQEIQSPVIKTSTHRVNANSKFDLDFTLSNFQRHIRLSLEPNHDVLGSEASVNYLNPDGSIARSENIARHGHKVYKGIVRAQREDGSYGDVGVARITVRSDGPAPLFEGSFTVNFDNHHVKLASNYLRTRRPEDPELRHDHGGSMVVFRDSDMRPSRNSHTELKRGEDAYMSYINQLTSDWRSDMGLFSRDGSSGQDFLTPRFGKRQDTAGSGGLGYGDLTATIGETAGCPSAKKIALVGVATDCGYTKSFENETDIDEAVKNNVIGIMNSASGVFEEAFNISLGLKNLTIMHPNCTGTLQSATPWNQVCSSNLRISDRLNLFTTWRNSLQDSNSHWTLLTSCPDGSAVGLAWVGSACTPANGANVRSANNGTGGGANVVASTGTEWQVVAHETGHTFGAAHDCDSDTCQTTEAVTSGNCCPLSPNACDANAQFIMNPYTTDSVNHFSPCTVGNVCSAMGRKLVNTACLSDNRAVDTFSGQQCGNGIVEGDEQCDCGDAASCANDPCCDASTCRFSSGSVCDDINEDCCNNCQFATNGTVCRPSTSSCDPEEVCPGNAGICPADITAPDGQSCSLPDVSSQAGSLACASGQCTSRNLQCMSAFGSMTGGSNDTSACDDQTCLLSCTYAALGPRTCASRNTFMLDGTPCRGGGHCTSGTCSGGSEVLDWIKNHKGVVIGIAVAVGVLLLIVIISCCCGCLRGRPMSRIDQNVNGPPVASGWYGPPPPGVPPPGVPPHQSPMQQPSGGWMPPQSPDGGWNRAASPQTWAPGPHHEQLQMGGLYGSGILGSTNPHGSNTPPPPLYPQRPPQSYFGGSMRYA